MEMLVDSLGNPLQIAIDGLAATGKTTVGVRVARKLNILFLDTGVLYRSFTLVVTAEHLDPGDERACTWVAKNIDLKLSPPSVDDGRAATVHIGHRDVTWEIRSAEIDRLVSQVAAHPRVREVVRARQHAIAKEQPIVMVGRDIASVVLPWAQVKVMLTASLEERVRRRAAELQERQPDAVINMAQLYADIEKRDKVDSVRTNATIGTHHIDTTNLTIDEVAEKVVQLTKQATDPTGTTLKLPKVRPE